MADSNRTTSSGVKFLQSLQAAPGGFDFHVVMRRLEAMFQPLPRWGEASRPSEEMLRLGQDPQMRFESDALASFSPPQEDEPGRLTVAFFGLFGPQGPLPLHLTEYARERILHYGDRTLVSFVNLFQHRMYLLFHRAWAVSQPTVARDRPNDRYRDYVGSLFGLGMRSLQQRDALPDSAKLQYAAWFASLSRNAEGLEAMVAEYFGVPTQVEQFVGEWVDLPESSRWRLGQSEDVSSLGRTTVVGSRVWCCSHKFRLVLGPLNPAQVQRFLPGGSSISLLVALVRQYVGDELDWDVRLIPDQDATRQVQLGRGDRLGWTSRIGAKSGDAGQDLVVHPILQQTRRNSRAGN